MRKTTLLLFTVLSALVARAGLSAGGGGDDDRPPQAPVENLYFATDEFIYVPVYTSSMGFRMLSGAKTSFSGKSIIASTSDKIGDPTGVYVLRSYADGSVGLDTRVNSDGTPMASADGYTPVFSYTSSSQESVNGYIAMHSYSATVSDTTPRMKDPGSMPGMELTIARDMPNWLGKRILVKLTGGFALNGIKSQVVTNVPAIITKTTDLYSLNGAAAPGVTYAGGGNDLIYYTNPDGSPGTINKSSVTLIGAQPANRSVTYVSNDTAVTNVYKVKGAFFSARVGPTFIIPFSESFRASISVGAMAIYAATTFDIEEYYDPEVGADMSLSSSNMTKKIMPGYYVDANLEYWISDKTGLYAGTAYQGGGTYTQTVGADENTYTTKIDLKSLSGVRAGMNIRF